MGQDDSEGRNTNPNNQSVRNIVDTFFTHEEKKSILEGEEKKEP